MHVPPFNPFASVNCRYGAPMGRHGNDPEDYNGTAPLKARHCGGDGYYDRGGAYWGHGRVWAVYWKDSGVQFCCYVEADNEAHALAIVRNAAQALA